LVVEVVLRPPPNSRYDEARLLKERRHLLRVVTAGTIIGCGLLEDLSPRSFELLVPDGVGYRDTLSAPGDRTHRAT
jgi:hypothetical protein